MVQPVIETGSSGTQVASTSQNPPHTAPVRDMSSSAGVPSTSRMALIQSACKLRDFQRDLPLASPDQLESPLDRSMTLSGRSLWIGVVNRRSIHSVPLFLS